MWYCVTKPSDSNNSRTEPDKDKSDELVRHGEQTPEVPVDYDPSSFGSARANWYFGKWDELAEIKLAEYENHPDRGKFALLKAAAHQQLGQLDETKKCVRLAREWKCDQKLISQVLIAGADNTLARAYALQENDVKAREHFEAAVSIGDSGADLRLASQARTVQELTRLGLLPQASKVLGESLQNLKSLKERPAQQQARINILETEIELINHVLSLAHQKNQLYLGRQHSTKQEQSGDELERLRKLSPSQLGQDLYVLEKTNYKRNGFFVEFGATDGVILSNTYLLEKEFEWEGICAEPNPKFLQRLRQNRNCIVTDACITGKTGEKINFILADEYGGIDGFSTKGLHKSKVENYKQANEVVELKGVSLNDFLLANNAPRKIEYISIDTEGNEYSILKNFPFDDWDVFAFSVEHNHGEDKQKIRNLMEDHGYDMYPLEWDDMYFKDPHK